MCLCVFVWETEWLSCGRNRQVGQGTANEVELLDLRAELEGKEQRHEAEKGKEKNTALGEANVSGNVGALGQVLIPYL